MSAYTPGPWEVGSDFVGPLKVMTSQDRHVVALVGDSKFVQAEANAHLIAAAPALLEALKSLRPILNMDAARLKPWAEYVAAIDAVIVKAEGTQP